MHRNLHHIWYYIIDSVDSTLYSYLVTIFAYNLVFLKLEFENEIEQKLII